MKIAVIGLGYVGLPLAECFFQAGFTVLGIDKNPKRIEELSGARIELGSDLKLCSSANAVILCLPTPLDSQRRPDLSYITETANELRKHLRSGTLVVLESTTWPGTTEEVLKPLLPQCMLAYSPERIDPGNSEFKIKEIPKLLAALDEKALEKALSIYQKAFNQVHVLDDCKTAEAAKLFENVFRSVNIALVNEMKMVLDALGMDIWEVIEAAKTKPFGFMPFYPGPGMGGHCVPVDPFYLSWKARQVGVSAQFIELAGEINRQMPQFVLEKTEQAIGSLKGARILILGISYKTDINDTRESPARPLWRLLKNHGASVSYFDPLVPVIGPSRSFPELEGQSSKSPSNDFDAFILCTWHSSFDSREILSYKVPVIDTRGVLPKVPGVFRA